MNNKLHELVFTLDYSSETKKQYAQAKDAFKSLIEHQKKCPVETNITLNLFGSAYITLADNVPIDELKLNKNPFDINGICPFIDSAVRTIDDVGERLSKTPEDQRPSKVIVTLVILGKDNASKRYTYPQLAEKIKHQTEVYNWTFYLMTDLSINMEKLGISGDKTFMVDLSYENSFADEYKKLSDGIYALRTGKTD